MSAQYSLPLAACSESSVLDKGCASENLSDHFLIMHKMQTTTEAYRAICIQPQTCLTNVIDKIRRNLKNIPDH